MARRFGRLHPPSTGPYSHRYKLFALEMAHSDSDTCRIASGPDFDWRRAVSVYAFHSFQIDFERFELRREGELVAIGPRAFDVLSYLIRHRDRAVSKRELIAKVWGVVALSAAAVPTCVSEIRRALGDDAGSPGFIVTLPKRGYRFAAPVCLVDEIKASAEGAGRICPDIDPEGTLRPFVGRDRELAAMAAAVVAARAHRPGLILLAGEAGIGKTRTAEEFLHRARVQGCVAIESRCHESEGAPAFSPWLQIVRATFEQCAIRTPLEQLDSLQARIAPLLPEWSDEQSSDSLSLAAHDPQAPRFRLFDGVTRLLERAAVSQPLVLMIDDLHRADPASLRLLQFVIRDLRSAAILIIGTYRDTELSPDSNAAHLLSTLIREPRARVLGLTGLSVQDVTRYLVESKQLTAAAPEIPETLHDLSAGNPFFLMQLVQLRTLTKGPPGRNQRFDSDGSLPSGVRQAIARQIQGLPDAARQVLIAASVLGREFNSTELAAALESPIDEIMTSIDAARSQRLLGAVEDHPRRYRFIHVLLRDSLYENIDTLQRIALHQRIGEVIAQLAGNDVAARAPELAHHFLKAAELGDSRPAIRYSILAAKRATAQLAFEDACRHYRTAIDLLAQTSGSALDRCELLLELGESQLRAGERDEARASFAEVADRTRVLGEPSLFARAALGLSPGLFAIEVGVIDPLLITLLEEALAGLGQAESILRAQVLARLAIALVWSEAEARRDEQSKEALAVARAVGDPATLALALIARHGVLWAPSRLGERIEILEELGHVAARATDSGLVHLHRVLEIVLHAELGEIDVLDPLLEAFTRTAETKHDPHILWYSELFQGVRAAMMGQRGDADRHARASLEYGQRVRDDNATNGFAAYLTLRNLQDGRSGEILDSVRRQVEAYPSLHAWRAGLALMSLESGNVAEARLHFEIIAVRDFAPLLWNEAGMITFVLLAEVCAALEDRRRAAILYEILQPAASHFAIVGFFSVFYGSVARFLGLLAATLGRHDEATAHFEFALRQNTRVGAPPFVAQTQYEFARFLLRRGAAGDRSRAESLFAEAQATADRLELGGLQAKLSALQAEFALEPTTAS
jgi:DNA-binding winged helix-turn-helix (wHTH) protein/tetratricopeptide (TPR) repeat protein